MTRGGRLVTAVAVIGSSGGGGNPLCGTAAGPDLSCLPRAGMGGHKGRPYISSLHRRFADTPSGAGVTVLRWHWHVGRVYLSRASSRDPSSPSPDRRRSASFAKASKPKASPPYNRRSHQRFALTPCAPAVVDRALRACYNPPTRPLAGRTNGWERIAFDRASPSSAAVACCRHRPPGGIPRLDIVRRASRRSAEATAGGAHGRAHAPAHAR